MGQFALRCMRGWMVFITTLNFLGMMACYISFARQNNLSYDFERQTLLWGDYVEIITAIGFLITYIYALRGPHRIHKFLRAFLLLVPTILVLYIYLENVYIVLEVYGIRSAEYYGYWNAPGPFTCGEIKDSWCYLYQTNMFMSLITGFFILIEIGMTLAWGPLEKAHRFGSHGYVHNANVVVVSPDPNVIVISPDQPQGYYLQQQLQQPYYPQMQQPQQQQPILLNPNSTPKIDHSANPQQYPQQQQQHNFVEQAPYTSSGYSQSPVITATGGYQPSAQSSPQPSL